MDYIKLEEHSQILFSFANEETSQDQVCQEGLSIEIILI